MSANSAITAPPSVDLDELLRSLKGASNSLAPPQGTDQQSSYLPNTHQGNASPAADEDASTISVFAGLTAPAVGPNVPPGKPNCGRRRYPLDNARSDTADHRNVAGSVQENAAAGTVVAQLGALDPDAVESFTYTLANDPSGLFEVIGNEVRLKAGATADYETGSLPRPDRDSHRCGRPELQRDAHDRRY